MKNLTEQPTVSIKTGMHEQIYVPDYGLDDYLTNKRNSTR